MLRLASAARSSSARRLPALHRQYEEQPNSLSLACPCGAASSTSRAVEAHSYCAPMRSNASSASRSSQSSSVKTAGGARRRHVPTPSRSPQPRRRSRDRNHSSDEPRRWRVVPAGLSTDPDVTGVPEGGSRMSDHDTATTYVLASEDVVWHKTDLGRSFCRSQNLVTSDYTSPFSAQVTMFGPGGGIPAAQPHLQPRVLVPAQHRQCADRRADLACQARHVRQGPRRRAAQRQRHRLRRPRLPCHLRPARRRRHAVRGGQAILGRTTARHQRRPLQRSVARTHGWIRAVDTESLMTREGVRR